MAAGVSLKAGFWVDWSAHVRLLQHALVWLFFCELVSRGGAWVAPKLNFPLAFLAGKPCMQDFPSSAAVSG